MAAYEANLENDSIAVQIGKTNYCLYKGYDTVDTVSYSLYAVSSAGVSTKLYSAAVGQYLDNISVYDGKVYFCRSTTGSERARSCAMIRQAAHSLLSTMAISSSPTASMTGSFTRLRSPNMPTSPPATHTHSAGS